MILRNWFLAAGMFVSLTAFTTVALTQDPNSQARPPANRSQGGPTGLPRGTSPLVRYRQEESMFRETNDEREVTYRPKIVARTVYATVNVPVSAEELKQAQAIHTAKEKLKNAKNDAARKEASDVIEKALIKQFEEDLVQREKELTDVEERFKRLRQQFERRKQAKDEIVSLRLKTIVNNAEGLGFPGDDDSRSASDDIVPTFTPDNPTGVRRSPDLFEPILDGGAAEPVPQNIPRRSSKDPETTNPRAI